MSGEIIYDNCGGILDGDINYCKGCENTICELCSETCTKCKKDFCEMCFSDHSC